MSLLRLCGLKTIWYNFGDIYIKTGILCASFGCGFEMTSGLFCTSCVLESGLSRIDPEEYSCQS